jgi:hypothetical protein
MIRSSTLPNKDLLPYECSLRSMGAAWQAQDALFHHKSGALPVLRAPAARAADRPPGLR